MSDNTAIEWTDATWNPIRARLRSDPGKVGWHCEHVSPGCANCYAETINQRRFGTGLAYKPGHRAGVEVYLDEKTLLQPLRWRRGRRVFVCSMTDLFGAWVSDEMLDRVFAVMALCPQHTFQVLTKRPARMREYLIAPGVGDMLLGDCRAAFLPLPNVWLGVSVEDQQRADERVPDLLATPAAVRWLSCEPLLGPIDFAWCLPEYETVGWIGPLDRLDWIVCGGESGPGARPMHPDWARTIRDQCAATGVPFFFKQWGEHAWCERIAGDPSTLTAYRAGKKRAGRLLDGVEHNGVPSHA